MATINPMLVPRPTFEEQLRAVCVQHLTLRPLPGMVWWTSGDTRHSPETGRFNALAVKPGIPDVFALRDGQLFALGLRRETSRDGPPRFSMIEYLAAAGAQTAAAYNIKDALATLEEWGLLEKNAHYSE